MIEKYKSNVKFRRTEFLSIEIAVLDEDAQMAADIANEIASYMDSVFYQDQKIPRSGSIFNR